MFLKGNPQVSPLLVEVILLLDIYQTVKNSKIMIRNMIDKKVAELNQGKTNPLSQMKLEHFIRSIKEDCLDENDERSTTQQEDNRKSQGFLLKNQEKFKESLEAFHRSYFINIFTNFFDFIRICYFEQGFRQYQERV